MFQSSIYQTNKMGSVASKVAQPYVFPGTQQSIGFSDDIELLPTDDPNYYIPYIHLQQNSPRAIVFYSHGNAENLYSCLDFLKYVSKELCVDIISWDYAGYGQHKLNDTVQPNEANVYKDALNIFDWIQAHACYRNGNKPILVFGRSLGSAPAIYVASQRPNAVQGLIVESGFRSISRVVSNTLHNLFDIFDNEKYIKQIQMPALFIHGKKDPVVPFAHGECLHELCACEKKYNFWIPNGHHNDLESSYHKEIFIRLNGLIDNL